MKISKRPFFIILSISLFFLISLMGFLGYKYISKGKLLYYFAVEYINLDGYAIAARDIGKKDGKTVIIEPGLSCSMDTYLELEYDLAKQYRVISYDHAGIGRSEPSGNPRLLPYYAEEFRALMKAKGVSPPYILIGHSMGGHIIRHYAYLYPDEVEALIFIDQPPEDWFVYIRNNWSEERQKKYFKYWEGDTTKTGVYKEEVINYEENCNIVRNDKIPRDIPVLMFTANNWRHFRHDDPLMYEQDKEAYERMSYDLIKDSTDATFIVDWEGGHYYHYDKPDFTKNEIIKFISGL